MTPRLGPARRFVGDCVVVMVLVRAGPGAHGPRARRRCRRLGRGRCSPPCHRPRNAVGSSRNSWVSCSGSLPTLSATSWRTSGDASRASGQPRAPVVIGESAPTGARSASSGAAPSGTSRANGASDGRGWAWPAARASPGPAPPIGWSGRPHCSLVAPAGGAHRCR